MAAGAHILTADRRLRRRKLVNRFMEALAAVAALTAVGLLALVIASVLRRGIGGLNADFFTNVPQPFGLPGSGIANALVGSLVLVAVATAMAVPLGILVAIYLYEFARGSVASVVRLALDILNGLPSIILGIFVFTLIVQKYGQSGWAGSAALAIIMLPLVARATQEVLALVPESLREAGFAVGASRWRTMFGVVLPMSFGGILTGTTLAVARAAGETAPLLFTTSLVSSEVTWDPREPLQSIPLAIFQLSESPDPADHTRAWAAAFVLIAFVLVTSLAARILLVRYRRKLGHER
jgi:phosphate transport system permease protein